MNLNAITASAKQQFQLSIQRNMFRFCVFVSPLAQGLILGMMYLNRSSEEFTVYAVFGSSLASFWGTLLFSSVSDIDRERYMGTLESIFIAPAGFKNILIGKIIGNTLWGIVSIAINVCFVLTFFHKSLVITDYGLALLTFILMLVGMVIMALMMAGVFTLSRSASLAMNCLEHPIYILSGLMFPLSMLPIFVRPISYLLIQTWSVKLFRISIFGGTFQDKVSSLLVYCILIILYAVLCRILYKKIEYRVRVSATLGVY